MNGYVLSKAAELDLNAIWEFIAQDSIRAADNWIAKLFDAFNDLASRPGMGHQRADLTSLPVLFWPVGTNLVIYRIVQSGIQWLPLRKAPGIFRGSLRIADSPHLPSGRLPDPAPMWQPRNLEDSPHAP